MQDAITSRGVVPAIAAVVRGVPTLGLGGADLERFLRREGVRKVSSRDLGAAIAQRADGATTVAATLTLARLAGIEAFATGGIGGVHRATRPTSATVAQDESADLVELARSKVVIVCSGPKAILDLPATLERLETLGIPVVGYRTTELPGFFSAQTGLLVALCSETAVEVAHIARAHWEVGNQQGLLVVQAPSPEHALPPSDVERAVQEALTEAERQGVRGASVTPFLLAAVSRLTDGRSLEANLALLELNAALAAEIASALHSIDGHSRQPEV
jgi:pseudouridine-5'-phosphate glycosidase